MITAVLAIDQGSHATRACLYDRTGRQIAAAQQSIAAHRPDHDRVEHDPVEILTSVQRTIAECLAMVPDAMVIAAGLATQRSSFVCLERASLQPLSPVLSWQDRRHARWLEQFAPQAARVRALTGLPLSAHYGASKMRWCLEHLPAVRAAAHAGSLCLAPLASYLVSALTGAELMVDPANASRTLLWDSSRLDWADELLALFRIDRALLPRSVDTCGTFGSLRSTGGGIPLVAVTGDQSAVPFAFGPPEEGRIYLNLGTGAFLQRPATLRPADAAPLLGSVLRTESGRALWSLEGTVNGAASAVSWFAAQQGCEEQTLWSGLANVPTDASLPIFVNGIGGLGSPWWQAHVESRFVGSGSRLQRFAAVLESMLFMITTNLELMQRDRALVETILVAGGMSRSDWLCQRLADITGRDVLRSEAEATASGVAMLALPSMRVPEAESPQRFSGRAQSQFLRKRYDTFMTLMPTPITAS